MSKSRLEKFLYALYSLDSSDLPTPLSRIEELYKCWVIGEEVPTFEPLSRVEKYLMAILGAYNVNELPNPLSRVEVLLYKLATGDDNLDDIKSFLSEHEELLAEIIRNGGAGGNINIEYILYTLSTEHNILYNTAEKPVKSAILKGSTEKVFSPLKNLFDGFLEIGSIDNKTGALGSSTDYRRSANFIVIEPSTNYIISTDGAANGRLYYYDINFNFISSSLSFDKELSPSNAKYMKFRIEETKKDKKIQVEKGEVVTDYEEPNYILQSVKMPVLTTTGKNLFDKNNVIPGRLDDGQLDYTGDSTVTILEDGFEVISKYNYRGCVVEKIKINESLDYCFSYNINSLVDGFSVIFQFLDKDYNYISRTTIYESTGIVSTPPNAAYVSMWFHTNLSTNIPITIRNVQLEEGLVATEYEPFKSNILTVNEEVELRGIGDVKDELDLITGELTPRIGEVVLDGSDDLVYTHETNSNDTTTLVYIAIPNTDRIFNFCNDKLAQKYVYDETYEIEGIFAEWSGLYIRLLSEKLSSPNSYGVKEYLQSNPVTVQYQLATPTIKTVDLSVVDQDGNDVELSTFNDITYVTLSSEGLIPEVELEVATKNEEVLNTMSLEMDDIFTTQNTLEETSNVQSENVDATMIATTEIYEGLL